MTYSWFKAAGCVKDASGKLGDAAALLRKVRGTVLFNDQIHDARAAIVSAISDAEDALVLIDARRSESGH